MEAALRKEFVPTEWEKSEIVSIYKQKSDALTCGNYREIKLLEHLTMISERSLEQGQKELIEIVTILCGQ